MGSSEKVSELCSNDGLVSTDLKSLIYRQRHFLKVAIMAVLACSVVREPDGAGLVARLQE